MQTSNIEYCIGGFICEALNYASFARHSKLTELNSNDQLYSFTFVYSNFSQEFKYLKK